MSEMLRSYDTANSITYAAYKVKTADDKIILAKCTKIV